jgi:hypothetical protein
MALPDGDYINVQVMCYTKGPNYGRQLLSFKAKTHGTAGSGIFACGEFPIYEKGRHPDINVPIVNNTYYITAVFNKEPKQFTAVCTFAGSTSEFVVKTIS